MTMRAIEALVAAVLAAERERCAKIADGLAADYEARAALPHAKGTPLWGQRMTQAAVASEVANAIRARDAKDGET